MNIESILKSMRMKTIPWDVTKEILERCDIPSGKGWDKTIEKVENLENTDSESGIQNQKFKLLLDFYKQTLICGEKSVCFYSINHEKKNLLIKHFKETRIRDSIFAQFYPLLISKKELETLPVSNPELIKVEFFDTGIAAIYSSVRTVKQKVSLKEEDVLNKDNEYIGQFSEIYGVKNTNLQAFDVVWIPYQEDEIELRVDCPVGITRNSYAIAHQSLLSNVFLQIGEEIEVTPLNLFPLIKKIYNEEIDAKIVELGFNTKTASTKHEKMRQKHCLRQEIYHQGGAEAIEGDIEPFKISAQWEVPTYKKRSFPELTLNGTFRMVHRIEPLLYECIIRNCINMYEFNIVKNNIKKYLDK